MEVGRTMPASPEAEEGVLGSLLIDPQGVLEACERAGLAPGWFHVPAHQTIFEQIREAMEKDGKVDFITLTTRLKDRGLLDEIGGPFKVTALFTFVPTAANVNYYLGICAEKFFLRSVIQAGTSLASRAYDDQSEIEELRAEAEAALISIADQKAPGKRQQSVKESMFAIMDKVEAGKTEETWGIQTGLPNLDAIARGLRASNMIAIGGETSAGKSALISNIVHNVCVRKSVPTLFFTLEVSREELTENLLMIGSGVNIDNAIEGRWSENEQRAFVEAGKALAGAPLTIFDEPDLSIIQARSIARRLKPRIVVLDYAQLMSGGKKRYERNDLEIADISRGAKKMAGELDATVFLLTQLNDDGKVAGSRAIKKDCNQLWIVTETGADTREVQVCKNRRGQRDRANFRFVGSALKFLPKALT